MLLRGKRTASDLGTPMVVFDYDGFVEHLQVVQNLFSVVQKSCSEFEH